MVEIKLSNKSLLETKGYIDGKFVASSSGVKFKVTNPYDDSVITEVEDFSVDQLKEAITNSHAAFQQFRTTTPRYRSDLLRKWYELIVEASDDLALIVSLENGKQIAEAKGEVLYAASFLEWFSEEAPRIYGDTLRTKNPMNRAFTVKKPVGVCGIITPWNFPAAMITRKLGAALAAGCTCVVRPASDTPLTAIALAVLAKKAGIPAGVFNVVPSSKSSAVGAEFSSNPLVKKISFTGSTKVGKILMSQSSATLTKLSLELGGNAPFIVFQDADIEKAVEGVLIAKFRQTGQTCVCANRIYVHEDVYDKFASLLVEKVKKFKLGSGLADGTTHGPLINAKAVDKVEQHVEDAKSKGAKVLQGGKRRPDLGANFYEPTVLAGVTKDMLCSVEETFGPLAPLISFKTEKEVVELANSSEFGLASYLFSKDISRVYRVSEHLESGMLGVNTGIISDAAFPFGGVKESGFGREGSKYGIEDYLQVVSVTIGEVSPQLEG